MTAIFDASWFGHGDYTEIGFKGYLYHVEPQTMFLNLIGWGGDENGNNIYTTVDYGLKDRDGNILFSQHYDNKIIATSTSQFALTIPQACEVEKIYFHMGVPGDATLLYKGDVSHYRVDEPTSLSIILIGLLIIMMWKFISSRSTREQHGQQSRMTVLE